MKVIRSALRNSLFVLHAAGALGWASGSAVAQDKPLITVKVGVFPIAAVAPLYVGEQAGIFAKEGLRVVPDMGAQGGAALQAAVLSGAYAFAFTNSPSVYLAKAGGMPVKIVAPAASAGATEAEAWDGLLVSKTSGITTPKDLEGKTVAVNTINNIGKVGINSMLEQRGVDYTKVKLIEVPFPEMNSLLESGKIDAAWMPTPFVTAGLKAGSKSLFSVFQGVGPSATVTVYMATDKFIAENADVVAKFQRGLAASQAYARDNPAITRKAISDYLKFPEAIASVMNLPEWKNERESKSIEKAGELMKRYGLLKAVPDLKDMIASGY